MNELILSLVMMFLMGASLGTPTEQATYVNVPNMAYSWVMPETQSSTDNMMLAQMLAQAIASNISWSDYDSQEIKISWDEGWEKWGWLEGSTVTLKKKSDGFYAKVHLVQRSDSQSYRDFSDKVQEILGDGFKVETKTQSTSSVTSDFEFKLF